MKVMNYLRHRRAVAIMILACLLGVALPAGAQSIRTVVTDETQLPRVAYPMPTPPSVFLNIERCNVRSAFSIG